MSAGVLLEVFERYRIALPLVLWRVDFQVLCNRRLRHFEEVVLKLVRDGVRSVPEIAVLMGLDDQEVVRRVIVDLLELMALSYDDVQRLVLQAPVGPGMLAQTTVEEERTFGDLSLHIDPVLGSVGWGHFDPSLLKANQIKRLGLHRVDGNPEDTDLSEHVYAIRRLVAHDSTPLANHPSGFDVHRFELLSVRALRPTVLYRTVWIEMQVRIQDGELVWRVLHAEREEVKLTERLHELEVAGQRVVPTVHLPNSPGNALEEILGIGARGRFIRIQIEQEIARIQDLMFQARKTVLVTAPTLEGSRLNESWDVTLRQALENQPALSATLVVQEGVPREKLDLYRSKFKPFLQGTKPRMVIRTAPLVPYRVFCSEGAMLFNQFEYAAYQASWVVREVLVDIVGQEQREAIMRTVQADGL